MTEWQSRRLPPWAPLAWFAATALALTLLVVVLVKPPGPLDDPRIAYQRDGLLRNGPRLPEQLSGVRFGGEPTALLFLRGAAPRERLQQWADSLPDGTQVSVVASGPSPTTSMPVIVDPQGRLATAVAMPTPVDGGPPVGYAVVDPDRRVRYATLDPRWYDNAFEVATIAGALT